MVVGYTGGVNENPSKGPSFLLVIWSGRGGMVLSSRRKIAEAGQGTGIGMRRRICSGWPEIVLVPCTARFRLAPRCVVDHAAGRAGREAPVPMAWLLTRPGIASASAIRTAVSKVTIKYAERRDGCPRELPQRSATHQPLLLRVCCGDYDEIVGIEPPNMRFNHNARTLNRASSKNYVPPQLGMFHLKVYPIAVIRTHCQ